MDRIYRIRNGADGRYAVERDGTMYWLEGDIFFGHAVGNDRGPMACFLTAAKALKKTGIDLAGTLYLTACPGEIGPERHHHHEVEDVDELDGADEKDDCAFAGVPGHATWDAGMNGWMPG